MNHTRLAAWPTLILLSLLILPSCRHKKDDPKPLNDMVYVDYDRLAPGNYWIYQYFKVDSQGNATAMNAFDSIYVEKDTVINSLTYHKRVTLGYGGPQAEFFRDSLHYLVTNSGAIYFSSLDFTSVFRSYYLVNPAIGPKDSIGFVEYRMGDRDKTVTVPAGTFTTSAFQMIWHMHPFYWSNGAVRTISLRFAPGVGLVSETMPFYLADPNYEERRLVRYYVQ